MAVAKIVIRALRSSYKTRRRCAVFCTRRPQRGLDPSAISFSWQTSFGAPVVMDKLGNHKGKRVRQTIEAAGGTRLFLPPYSPDFNPIENAFAKIKTLLRRAAERTVAELWDRIGAVVDLIARREAQNYFNAAGYGPA